MRLGLDVNVSMKLEQKLSPQMIQSLKLLQVTSLQLETMVQQELEVNPLLENGEEDEEGEGGDDAPEEPKEEGEASDDGLEEVPDVEKPDEIDWEAFFEDGFDPGYKRSEEKIDPDERLQKQPVALQTLQDNLLVQFQFRHMDPETRELVEYLVNCLDDDGYFRYESGENGALLPLALLEEKRPELREIQAVLTGDLEEIRASLPVREAFNILRSLDPPGIGARNLRECLLLQIRRREGFDELAKRIVEEAFNLLEKLKISAIARKLDTSPEKVQAAIRTIGTLEPRPGRLLTESLSPPVIPDLIVKILDGEILLLFNDNFMPSIRISRNYSNLLRKGSGAKPEEKKFVREKLSSATWLIRAIEQRKTTMMKVMHAIIESQPEFFTEGPTHLRPLILQNIAEKIDMHISTISRVINGKYVQTPHGIFELKYFFTSGVENQDGEDISSLRIKEEIKHLVEKEDSKRPFSDQKIADLLKTNGFPVARRTVAKYRDQLEILPGRLRKQF